MIVLMNFKMFSEILGVPRRIDCAPNTGFFEAINTLCWHHWSPNLKFAFERCRILETCPETPQVQWITGSRNEWWRCQSVSSLLLGIPPWGGTPCSRSNGGQVHLQHPCSRSFGAWKIGATVTINTRQPLFIITDYYQHSLVVCRGHAIAGPVHSRQRIQQQSAKKSTVTSHCATPAIVKQYRVSMIHWSLNWLMQTNHITNQYLP